MTERNATVSYSECVSVCVCECGLIGKATVRNVFYALFYVRIFYIYIYIYEKKCRRWKDGDEI